jgi:hypothetical protein
MLNKPLLIALVATSFVACSSSSTNPDASGGMDTATNEDAMQTADTGTSGMDATVTDNGVMMTDSGTPDPGTMTTCDPVLQTGCGAMMSCYPIQGGTSCQMTPAMPAADGAACGAMLCKPGSGCLAINNGMLTCFKLCRTAMMNTDCMTGTSTANACVGLRGVPYGVCVPNCNPFNDMCPANETCSPVGNGNAICLPGQSAAGASCSNTGSCVRGYICLGTTVANLTCDQLCDATHTCPMGKNCTMLQGYNYGGCM